MHWTAARVVFHSSPLKFENAYIILVRDVCLKKRKEREHLLHSFDCRMMNGDMKTFPSFSSRVCDRSMIKAFYGWFLAFHLDHRIPYLSRPVSTLSCEQEVCGRNEEKEKENPDTYVLSTIRAPKVFFAPMKKKMKKKHKNRFSCSWSIPFTDMLTKNTITTWNRWCPRTTRCWFLLAIYLRRNELIEPNCCKKQ